MANCRRYNGDPDVTVRLDVCVACRSRLCRECEVLAVTQARDIDPQHHHLCLPCSSRVTGARPLRTAGLVHSHSLQDDRLLSGGGAAYHERRGHTTSARAMLDDSEDWPAPRRPGKDAKAGGGSTGGRRRLPSESALSSLIASARTSLGAWRHRKRNESTPALTPVAPTTAADYAPASGRAFEHHGARSINASSSVHSSVSHMELPTVDLRTRRRKPQRRPTSAVIDYSFSVSELELSTVDLRRPREHQRRKPTLMPSSSMPDVTSRGLRGVPGRGGDAALRMAAAKAPARPDPLSISYVKHYK